MRLSAWGALNCAHWAWVDKLLTFKQLHIPLLTPSFLVIFQEKHYVGW